MLRYATLAQTSHLKEGTLLVCYASTNSVHHAPHRTMHYTMHHALHHAPYTTL